MDELIDGYPYGYCPHNNEERKLKMNIDERIVNEKIPCAIVGKDIYTITTLAGIENHLNHWEWDGRLGEKPTNWDTMCDFSKDKNVESKYKIITPIMKGIKDVIGIKECLRWHHLNNLNRTNNEFEEWWKNYENELA